MFDELSVSFENPATDAMGYEAVQGKLFCGLEKVELQFKEKDRAFRRNETITIEFDYGEIEKVEFVSRWFRPKILVFQPRSPERLSEFPGTDVGRVELQVLAGSVRDAKRVTELIRFRQSEALLERSESRIFGDRAKE